MKKFIFITYVILVTGISSAQYCNVGFSDAVEPITRVVFSDINNSSSPIIDGSPELEDFTSIIGNVSIFGDFPIAVEGNTDGNFTARIVVFIDFNQNNSFADPGESFQLTNLVNSTGVDGVQSTGVISIPLNALVGQTRMRVVKRYNTVPGPCNTAGYGQAEDYTLEIHPGPSCLPVSNLNITDLTDQEGNLIWTSINSETDWNIEWGNVGFTPDTGEELGMGISTAENFMITGLTPSTTYHVYVKADCGGGNESSWAGPLSFTTSQIPISTFPWIEDFETGATNWTITNGPALNQWVVGNATENGGTSSLYVSNDGGTSNAYSTNAFSVVHAYRDIEIPSSALDIEFGFDWKANGESCCDFLQVWAVPVTFFPTPGTAVGNTITSTGTAPSGRINLTGNLNLQSGWNNYFTSIPQEYAGETFRLVFQWRNDGSSGNQPPVAVDNIMFNFFTCHSVSNLEVSNLSFDAVELSWTENGTSTEWDIEYGAPGFAIGTGTFLTVNQVPFELTGLTEDMEYEVYVRAVCSPSDESAWIGPLEFTTPCAIFSAPFHESFDSSIQPDCWDNTSSGTGTNAFWKFNATAGGVDYGAAANGRPIGTFAWSDGSTPTPNDVTLTTPQIDLTTVNDPYLTFEWFSNNVDNPGDNVPLQIEINGGSVWTVLDVLSGDSSEWQLASYDLSDYTDSIVRIRFITDQTATTGSAFYNDILIDEVKVLPCIPTPSIGGSFNVCFMDETVDLDNLITIMSPGGRWHFPSNENLLSGSILNILSLQATSYNAYYIAEGACENDSTIAVINIYGPSSAGNNGMIETCNYGPLYLFDALTGNVDLGGTWYDPEGNALPNAVVNFNGENPSIYIYSYVASNGVCPAETSFVQVLLQNCASIAENELSGFSLYPNPTSNMINVQYSGVSTTVDMVLADTKGSVIFNQKVNLSSDDKLEFDLSKLVEGVYFLNIYSEEGSKTIKVVRN